MLVHHFCEDIMWFQDAHSGHNPVSQGSNAHNDTIVIVLSLRATSLTRLRDRDHYTSSTLIGGKGGAGPSSLHTTLERRTEYVNARWMWSLHGFRHGIQWIMFRGHCNGLFSRTTSWRRSNTKPGDHDDSYAHNRWFILLYHVWGPAWIEIHWNSIWLRTWSRMTSHYTWGSVSTLHDFGGVVCELILNHP